MTSEEQCEAWIEDASRRIEEKGFIPLTSHTMQWMRAAWKASRESLVIPLPHSANGYMDGCSLELELMDADEVRESIHAAGVKTK